MCHTCANLHVVLTGGTAKFNEEVTVPSLLLGAGIFGSRFADVHVDWKALTTEFPILVATEFSFEIGSYIVSSRGILY